MGLLRAEEGNLMKSPRGAAVSRRRIQIFQYRIALVQMRRGASEREIARSHCMGRHKLAELRALAEQHGWLDAQVPLPEDAKIAAALGAPKLAASTVSTLESHRERIAGLSREDAVEKSQDVDADIAEVVDAAATARMIANSALRKVLGPGKYQNAVAAVERQGKEAALAGSSMSEHPSKDQKVVEIETAAMIAERLVSWAKLFAWFVAVPAALLIAILTVIGISKFSDFMALVSDSEKKLTATVKLASTNADLFAQKVGDLTQKQAEADRQLNTLSQDLKRVTESLGFTAGSSVAPDAQKLLQKQFTDFQAFVVGLGYAPGTREIKLTVRPDLQGAMAYYSEGTIFVDQKASKDPEIIYREYLHHVLYSKAGLGDIGPERSALESGVADYLVASYAKTPRIYRLSMGTPLNLEEPRTIKPARGLEDRFRNGYAWASLFFQLRQAVDRDIIDKAVFDAWFGLPKDAADASIPSDMMSGVLARVAPAPESPYRSVFVKVAKEHGAPLPKDVSGR